MEVRTLKILTNFLPNETGELKWEPVEMAGYTVMRNLMATQKISQIFQLAFCVIQFHQ